MVPTFPSSSTYFFWLDISLSYDWNISRSCKYFVYQIWAVNVEWQAPRGPGRCQKVMGTRAQTWHYHWPAQLWHTLPCSPPSTRGLDMEKLCSMLSRQALLCCVRACYTLYRQLFVLKSSVIVLWLDFMSFTFIHWIPILPNFLENLKRKWYCPKFYAIKIF